MIPRANGTRRSPGIESDGIHETDVIDRSMRMTLRFLGVLHREQLPRFGHTLRDVGAAVVEAGSDHPVGDVDVAETGELRLARLPHTTLLAKDIASSACRDQRAGR